MSINQTSHFKELNLVLTSKYTLPLVGVQRKIMFSHRSFTGIKIWKTADQNSVTDFLKRFMAVHTHYAWYRGCDSELVGENDPEFCKY